MVVISTFCELQKWQTPIFGVVTPGKTRIDKLSNYRVYTAPEDEIWKLPLMVSLLEIKCQNWEILFDDESDEEIKDNDLISMIDEVATS